MPDLISVKIMNDCLTKHLDWNSTARSDYLSLSTSHTSSTVSPSHTKMTTEVTTDVAVAAAAAAAAAAEATTAAIGGDIHVVGIIVAAARRGGR